MILATCLGFPVFILCFLQSNFSELKSDYNLTTFGSIYTEIRLESRLALLQNMIFVVRRLLFCGIALVLPDYPFL